MFRCSCKTPMETPPAPHLRGLSSRPLKQASQAVTVRNWLPATPHRSPRCRGCWGHANSGNGCDRGCCRQLSSASTTAQKVPQLGHGWPRGWSLLCRQSGRRAATRPPTCRAFFSTFRSQPLLLCTDESAPLSILQYANHSVDP